MKQFKRSVSAMQEETKFLSYVPDNKWPEKTETMRMNLLSSTALDSDIVLNMSIENNIHPILLNLLRRMDSDLAQKYYDSVSHRNLEKDDNLGKKTVEDGNNNGQGGNKVNDDDMYGDLNDDGVR